MNFNDVAAGGSKVFGVVLEATALASILIVLVAIVQWLAGKRLGPSWRFALWGIVLVRLLAPIAPESRLSVFNATRWLAGGSAEPVVTMQVEPATLVVPEMAGDALEAPFPTEAPAFASDPEIRQPLPWRMIAVSVWGAGVVWFLGRLLVGSWWLRRQIRAEVPAAKADKLNAILAATADEMRMRRIFRVVEIRRVSSPALFGMFRPQLLVPRGFAHQLNAQELRHVLLHELAHLKRGDLITNWLMTVAQAVHWFNPLVWLAFRQMRVERELACDEMVLRATCGTGTEEGRAYGETILRLLEGVKSRRSLPALVGIAEEKHSARKRILQIVGFDASRPRRRTLGVLLLLALGVGGLTNAQIKRAENAEEIEKPTSRSSSPNEKLKLEEVPLSNLSKAVNDARLLLEAGRLDEAEAKLQEVLKGDPENRAAFYYSKLIEERRVGQKMKREAMSQPELKLLPFGQRQEELMPIADRPPNPYVRTNRFDDARDEGIDLDAREAELLEGLKGNPRDTIAGTELKELKEKRYAQEALKREVASGYLRGPNQSNRAAMMKKLNEMVVDYYEVPNGVRLSEVIKDIHQMGRKLDPEKVGVNIIISSKMENPGLGGLNAPIDPITGLTAAPLKVGDYVITISPALRNVTMMGLIDAIVEVAEPPKGSEGAPGLRYSVEDYAIVFGQRFREEEPLYTRTFKVEPNTFIQGLRPVVDVDQVFNAGGPDRPWQVQRAVRDFFTAAGINFEANPIENAPPGKPKPPQKAIFFNERTAILMVRATQGDLELVEKALQTMQAADLEQVVMTVEVVEVKSPEQLSKLIGMMNIRGDFRTTLTTTEFRTMERAATNGGFQWLKMPRVSTRAGHPARVSMEEKVSVDLTCEYREKDKTFRVVASSTDPKNGKSETKTGVVYDGQTFVLMPGMEGGILKPARVVFITPDLINSSGNFKNKGDDDFTELIGREVPED